MMAVVSLKVWFALVKKVSQRDRDMGWRCLPAQRLCLSVEGKRNGLRWTVVLAHLEDFCLGRDAQQKEWIDVLTTVFGRGLRWE
jgi:hypothetical protein